MNQQAKTLQPEIATGICSFVEPTVRKKKKDCSVNCSVQDIDITNICPADVVSEDVILEACKTILT